MRYLTDFQKKVIDELLEQLRSERIELSKILLKFLPEHLYLKKGLIGETRAFYTLDQYSYVRSDVSIKVLEFMSLVKDLTKKNYLIRVEPESQREEFRIGATDQPQFVGIRLSTDISAGELDKVFVKYDYFVTGKLSHLKEHDYKEDDDYRADRNLRYAKMSALGTILVGIAGILTTLILAC
jgi:hypothetical protein